VSISEALDPPKAILLLRGIRDFTAKCRDFEMKKVRKSAEKDSLAEREGFEPSIELLAL
jgi:hypothetical protein